MNPKSVALLSTVGLLVSLGFSLLGTVPLLILKHQNSMDASFIRSVFRTCYAVVIGVTAASALGYLFAGVVVPGLCALAFALGLLALRHAMLSRMDRVRASMAPDDGAAIRAFRRLHLTGIAINASLLASVAWVMTQFGL